MIHKMIFMTVRMMTTTCDDDCDLMMRGGVGDCGNVDDDRWQ